MAITFTASATRNKQITVTVAGASNSTAYVLKLIDPSGAQSLVNVTTDGSGAATAVCVPTCSGTLTAELRPATEHLGTTSAAQSATATVGASN